MKCEIIRNGAIIAGPAEYNESTVRSIVARHGGNLHMVPPNMRKKITIGSITIYPVVEEPVATSVETTMDTRTRRVEEDRVVYSWSSRTRTLQEAQAYLKQQVSAIHDAYEGRRIEYQGAWIAIDLEARINVTGLVEGFESGAYSNQGWRGKQKDEMGNYSGLATVNITSTEEAISLKSAIVGAIALGFTAREGIEATIDNAVEIADLTSLDVESEFDAVVSA